jgi:hypothetical protein
MYLPAHLLLALASQAVWCGGGGVAALVAGVVQQRGSLQRCMRRESAQLVQLVRAIV